MHGAGNNTQRRLTPAEFRDVIGRFASGVAVVTTTEDGTPHGTTASALTSLSLDPPMILICMNRSSATGQAIERTERFAVNILGEGHADVAMRFAVQGGDKFAGVTLEEPQSDLPLLRDALATLVCRVSETVTGGTHNVFLAEVERAFGQPGAPLAYFRGKFGRLQVLEDDEAYAAVRAAITRRDIAVDEPLEVTELANAVDLPAPAVHRALVKLAGEGLVNQEPDGSFVVPAVTLDVVVDALRARMAMLLGAMALGLGTISEETIAECRRLAEAAAPEGGGDALALQSWLSNRTAFADSLVSLADSAALLDAFHRVDVPMMIMRLWGRSGTGEAADLEPARSAYTDLADTLTREDPAALLETARRVLDVNVELYTRLFGSRSQV